MKHEKLKIIALTITLASTLPGLVFSEVFHRQVNDKNTFVDVKDDAWQPEGFKNGTTIPAAYIKVANITLDGQDSEPDWASAIEVTVPMDFGSVKAASLKALYTDDEVFIRVRWKDETENRKHHPWVWDVASEQYVTGPQIEDSIILSFEAGCEWSPSFLDGYVYDFDGWQWLAARSDPLGQAVDLGGTIQSQDSPQLNFVKYPSRNTEAVWNVKFTADVKEDELHANWNEVNRTYYRQPARGIVYVRSDPDDRNDFVQHLPAPEMAPPDETTSYPQYSPLKLEGGSGDVSAKGHWKNGYWTVEFRRARFTSATTLNDTVFNRITQFAVHIYDQVERVDQASESERLFLRFIPEGQMFVKD